MEKGKIQFENESKHFRDIYWKSIKQNFGEQEQSRLVVYMEDAWDNGFSFGKQKQYEKSELEKCRERKILNSKIAELERENESLRNLIAENRMVRKDNETILKCAYCSNNESNIGMCGSCYAERIRLAEKASKELK